MTAILRPAISHLRPLLILLAAAATFTIPAPLTAQESAAPRPNYTYYVEFLRVVDANTVALDIDLGFGIWLRNQNLDLQGLPEPAPMASETPEQKTARLAQASRLRDLLTNRTDLILTTTKDKTPHPTPLPRHPLGRRRERERGGAEGGVAVSRPVKFCQVLSRPVKSRQVQGPA